MSSDSIDENASCSQREQGREAAPEAIQQYIAALASDDANERGEAAGKLSFFGVEAVSAIPFLKVALGDPVAEVRQTATVAIGAIIEAIVQSAEPAKSALDALRRLYDSDSGESLPAVLEAVERLERALSGCLRGSTLSQKQDRGIRPGLGSAGPGATMAHPLESRIGRCDFHRRAYFALESLPPEERSELLGKLNEIVALPVTEWPPHRVARFAGDEALYLLRVNESLRAILHAEQGGDVQVLDLVRHDTLRTFGAHQDVS